MPGPIDALRFIHAAIVRDVAAIEREGAGAQSPAEVARLGERIAFLGYVVKGHTDGEEFGLYDTLEARAPHVGAAYRHDHVDEQKLFGEVASIVADATTGAGPQLLRRLQRQTIALTEHLGPHVAKENDLVLPLVCQLYSPGEQGEIVGKILSRFAPADLAKVVPWMAAWLTQDERASYLGALQRTQPEERFRMLASLVKQGTPPGDWAALVGRVPQLA